MQKRTRTTKWTSPTPDALFWVMLYDVVRDHGASIKSYQQYSRYVRYSILPARTVRDLVLRMGSPVTDEPDGRMLYLVTTESKKPPGGRFGNLLGGLRCVSG